MLDGRMMDFPLTLTHFLERARRYFPRTEIVSRRADGRCTARRRRDATGAAAARQRARPPRREAGDRVATLAWNHRRHLEAYCAVPTMGAVAPHAEPAPHPTRSRTSRRTRGLGRHRRRSLLPLLHQFVETRRRSIRHVIVMRDDGAHAGGGKPRLRGAPRRRARPLRWPDARRGSGGDHLLHLRHHREPQGGRVHAPIERAARAGHRACPTSSASRIATSSCPWCPMFHANAWGLAATPRPPSGAKLVFPGPKLDAESLLDLMAGEG